MTTRIETLQSDAFAMAVRVNDWIERLHGSIVRIFRWDDSDWIADGACAVRCEGMTDADLSAMMIARMVSGGEVKTLGDAPTHLLAVFADSAVAGPARWEEVEREDHDDAVRVTGPNAVVWADFDGKRYRRIAFGAKCSVVAGRDASGGACCYLTAWRDGRCVGLLIALRPEIAEIPTTAVPLTDRED